jgi:hypothetical protein
VNIGIYLQPFPDYPFFDYFNYNVYHVTWHIGFNRYFINSYKPIILTQDYTMVVSGIYDIIYDRKIKNILERQAGYL